MNIQPKAVLLLLLVSISCQDKIQPAQKELFAPSLIALCVEDIDVSIHWYTQYLGFEVEKEIQDYPDYGLKLAFLKLDSFHLEIMEMDKSLKPSAVLPNAESYLGGVFKLGFKSNDLEKLFNELKRNEEVKFLTGLGDLPKDQMPIPWPKRYFLIQDPDGNFIQFFDSGHREISPWITMIIVDHIEASKSWYATNLGFSHIKTVGEEGNKRAILKREDFIIELYEPEKFFYPNQVTTDTTIMGFRKLAFGVSDIVALDSLFQRTATEVVRPIEDSDFDWAQKAMIVKDPEGNWTQLFELKE